MRDYKHPENIGTNKLKCKYGCVQKCNPKSYPSNFDV